jgi:RNA polymerase sigma factor (sigma-70 family)
MPANASRFTEIVARERSRLGNFIRGHVRDAADAEDILQDVLLEFYAATDAVEQAGAWLFRVAKNRIIDRARKKREEPRRARSLWSKANRAKAEALIQSGRMQPSGMAEIDRARSDGRWDAAYDGARTAVVPPDLQTALDALPEAQAFFSQLDTANRYAVLWRVQTAKRPETRSSRIETLVAMLARGEKIHG